MKEQKAAAQTALLEAIATLAPHSKSHELRDLAEAYSYVKSGDPSMPRGRVTTG